VLQAVEADPGRDFAAHDVPRGAAARADGDGAHAAPSTGRARRPASPGSAPTPGSSSGSSGGSSLLEDLEQRVRVVRRRGRDSRARPRWGTYVRRSALRNPSGIHAAGMTLVRRCAIHSASGIAGTPTSASGRVLTRSGGPSSQSARRLRVGSDGPRSGRQTTRRSGPPPTVMLDRPEA
jgi:hypothetical protein